MIIISNAKKTKGKLVCNGINGEIDISLINQALLEFALYRTIYLSNQKEASQ